MALTNIDVNNIPMSKLCRKCKTIPVNSDKCVLCGSVLQPGSF